MLKNFLNHNVNFYQGTEPEFDLKEYFNGSIKAWGIVQNWRGRVVSRFDIKMIGKWEGGVGTLTEDFAYYNQHQQHRVWTITEHKDGRYSGTAPDIIGIAKGRSNGCAMQWNYVMDLEVSGRKYRIKFDDWMWLMNDGVLINRSYLKKFGITVAELTIFMQKQ